MRVWTMITLALAVASSARAQTEPECTTTTTTTTTCKGSAAPYAAPTVEAPAPIAPPGYALPPPQFFAPPAAPPVTLQPVGTHEEERHYWGLVGAGTGIFLGSWLLTSSIAYMADEAPLAVPILGPLMEIGKVHSCDDCSDDSGARLVKMWLVFDALVQAGGLVMAIAGATAKHKVTVFDRVSIIPAASPTGMGLAATGRF